MTRLDARRLEAAGLTNVGMVRQSNQDAFGESGSPDGSARVFVVADGMGGHAGGETASRLAVEALSNSTSPKTAMIFPFSFTGTR